MMFFLKMCRLEKNENELCFFHCQFFVRLDYIRKCFTQKGGIFVLEEYSTRFAYFNSFHGTRFTHFFNLRPQIPKRGRSSNVAISRLW